MTGRLTASAAGLTVAEQAALLAGLVIALHGPPNPVSPTELIQPEDPLQGLADAYGVDVWTLQNCLLNYNSYPEACRGLPDELLEILGRMDRGDGRDWSGRFTGEGGYG